MGSSRWSDSTYGTYASNVTARTADPRLRSSTAHTVAVTEGRAARKAHQALDPNGVTVRESRDSAVNPNSLGIAVMFDVTGSMGEIPVVLQRKLKTLMTILTDRNYVADPAVLFGAINDATCQAAPLQIGQFESDIQMDEDMSRMWLEGGGGGHVTESYELAYYFAARHTALDCVEKRAKKGYLFTIGDEMPYPQVNPAQVRKVFGAAATLVQPVTTAEMLAEAERKFNVFHILAETSTSRRHPVIGQTWRELLGDRVLPLADPEVVAELIALVIGISEGVVDEDTGAQHLQQMGVSEASIQAITAAVTNFARAIRVRA
jgi:hypothetical protein